MTDREAFREFARGITFVITVMGVFVLFIALKFNAEPEPKFEVVDKYKECDVVRYTDRSNTWHYLLDCSVNRTSKDG